MSLLFGLVEFAILGGCGGGVGGDCKKNQI
jgi:hypothetical protein